MKKIFFLLIIMLLTGIMMRAVAQPGYSQTQAIVAGSYSSSGSFTDTRNSATGGYTNNYGNAANDVWYSFTLSSQATIVQVSLCGSSFDTYLHVLNSSGTEIASNDDDYAGCGGPQSTLSMTNLAAGTYYIVAEGYSNNNGTINLSMNVSMVPSMTISYAAGSKIFTAGTAITPLSPTVAGGPPVASAQTSTFAGIGSQGLGNGNGSTATFRLPLAVAADGADNIYVADADNHAIRKITPGGVVSTLAGNGSVGNTNGTGTSAYFNHPAGLAIDASGNIFVADQMNNLIRKVTPAGVVTTFAGSGSAGSSNGTGTGASFNNPTGVCFDNVGNLLVADYSNNMIRKVTPAGVVTTYAGTGIAGANNGTLGTATFKNPMSMVTDVSGNIYVADRLNNLIRKITPAGVVSTLAGSGVAGYADGTGTTAIFKTPTSLKADQAGNLYVTDQGNYLIRKITPAGVVTTLAGGLTPGMINGSGTAARFANPYGLCLDSKGNIYVADAYNYMIRKIITRAFAISPSLPAGLVMDSNTGIISGTPTVLSPPMSYTITAYSEAASATATLTIGVIASGGYNFSADQNYIVTYTPRIEELTTSSAVTSMEDKTKVMVAVRYFDGLNRPMQAVQVKGSPSGKDIVQPISYDEFGRETFKYLPYALKTGNSDGNYKTDALTAQPDFYTLPPTGVSVVPGPFALTVFEPSPLNRVTEQGASGTDWQPVPGNTSGHTGKTIYGTNNTTALTDTANCTLAAKYTISAINATTQQRTLARNGNYNAGELYLTISKDENWKDTGLGKSRGGTKEEYKDKEGHVILKRTFNWLPATSKLEILSTYYVYDDLGNLAYVLPPAANPDAGLTSEVSQTILDNLCYQYSYDERNRLTQKKLPGKGWEFFVYNKLDQVTATQDANQRAKATPEWTVTRYDASGRVVMTGTYNYGATGADVRAALQTTANNQATLWETPTGTSGNYGYTAASFPVAINTILTVNYYDNYVFAGTNPYPYAAGSSRTKSLPTGTLTNVLGTSGMLWNVFYYNDQARNVKIYKQHYLGGGTPSLLNYDEISNDYYFTDEVKSTIRKHYTKSGSTAVLTVTNNYDYDHMGRKLNTWEQITNGTLNPDDKVLLAKNDYNETGQLWKKSLHSADQGLTFKQGITYTYNERGWLSKTDAPLFEESLQYNTAIVKNGLTPVRQYNGNIASQSWGSTAAPDTKTYIYRYDLLNRLTAGNSSDNYNESNIEYDLNGNINKLKRTTGSATFTDDLQYTYTNAAGAYTNQLQSINDITASDVGQKHGSFTYAYDANGNLVTDNSKGITGANGITYNLLNQPQSIASKSTTYTYDATGQKLSRLISTARTDYISGIQYETIAGVTAISFIQTEEGRALPNGATAYNYEYALTDHLGNSRVNFDTGTGTARPVQADNYYPFGMDIVVGSRPSPENKYLYNKKELQANLGLYDYGARFYDPVIARWAAVDPLAEMSQNMSGYAFCNDNPILFTDLLGMSGDTAKVHKLSEVTITGYKKVVNDILNRALFISLFTNPFKHDIMQRMTLNTVDNANNLSGLLKNSLTYTHKTNLTGNILDKLKKDNAMIAFKQKLIKLLKADARFKKLEFKFKDQGDLVSFGGEDAWSSLSNFENVAGNELTWAVRHVFVNSSGVVKTDGTIVINYQFSDTLDLSAQPGRGIGYNAISAGLGLIYHDIMGGNPGMKVNASWQEITK